MTYTSALRGTGNFLANCATTGRYRAGMQINRAIDDAFVGGKLNGSSIKVTITPKGGIEIPGVQTNRPYVYPVLWRLANVTGTRELDVSIDATFLDIGAMLNVARQEHFTAAEVAVRNNEPGISHGLETSIPYLSRMLLRNIPAGLFLVFGCGFNAVGTLLWTAAATVFTFVQPHLIASGTINVMRGMSRAVINAFARDDGGY